MPWLGLLTFVAIWNLLPAAEGLEVSTESMRYQARGPVAVRDVVVVAVDDRTNQAWSSLPKVAWPAPLAEILDRVVADGARAVALDFVFEFDTDAYLGELGSSEEPIGRLASSLRQLPDRIFLAAGNVTNVVPALFSGDPPVPLVSADPIVDPGGRVVAAPRLDSAYRPSLPGMAAALVRSYGTRSIAINYSVGRVPVVSAEEVRLGNFKPGTFTNKMVLVGETYAGSQDLHPTPLGQEMHGVLIHAEAVATLTGNRELVRLSPLLSGALTLALAAPFVPLAWRTHPVQYGLVATLAAVGYGAATQWAFSVHYWVLPVLGPVGAMLLACPLCVYLPRWATEARERQWARERWGQMVSVPFRERIEANRRAGRGDWGTLEAAFLFLDVEGFSKATLEEPDQGVIIARLNKLFPVVVEVLESHGGAVLQFTGDGLSALFEASSDRPLGAAKEQALTAALEIIDRTGPGSGHWSVRMGLAAGPVQLALIGSEGRSQMTTYGEAINMAARMEQAGKKLSPRRRLVVTADFGETVVGLERVFEPASLALDGWPEPVRVLGLVEG